MTGHLGGSPVTFVGSFPDPSVQLDPVLPEIAFIGRSNVGKSSLLNALTGESGLARVSATPGKTTLLNVYQLANCYLVDLPGYGWARASKTARHGYRQLVDTYILKRQTLAGVTWLLDIRHDPSADDLAMQELLVRAERPALIVFTKADKLTQRERSRRAKDLRAALGLHEDQVQVVSSRTGYGISELGASLLAATDAEEEI